MTSIERGVNVTMTSAVNATENSIPLMLIFLSILLESHDEIGAFKTNKCKRSFRLVKVSHVNLTIKDKVI